MTTDPKNATVSLKRSAAKPMKGAKKKKSTNTNIAQTLPDNFKYGLPPSAPHIVPAQPLEAIPKSLSFSLPPANKDVGVDISKMGSMSMKVTMSMPAKFFMGRFDTSTFKSSFNQQNQYAKYGTAAAESTTNTAINNKTNQPLDDNNNNDSQTQQNMNMTVGSFPCLEMMGGGTSDLAELSQVGENVATTADDSNSNSNNNNDDMQMADDGDMDDDALFALDD